MDFISDIGMFFLKTMTILSAVIVIISVIFAQKKQLNETLQISCINDLMHEEKSKIIKKLKWKHLNIKYKKQDLLKKPKLFVLDFYGDIKASQTQQLRNEISLVVSLVQPRDEVMIRLESPGGAVNGYGLAASQIERLRSHNIPTTICIDQVAASGGYLMACIANRVIAAPFAIIGSIGVVSQLPNFNKWLKKHDIDYEQITAGEYKRTLTIFGQNTEEGRKKYAEDLEVIHQHFKEHVSNFRPQLQIEKVATGEHWLAKDGLTLGLVDELKTSDEWLLEQSNRFQIIALKRSKPQSLVDKYFKPAINEVFNIMSK